MTHFVLPGSKNVVINDAPYLYTGELDSKNNACGEGELVRQNTEETIKFSGTFLDDKKHGIGELLILHR